MDDLLAIEARKLLEKFGKGEHVPGSGSAAAFQGLLSAQLTLTVSKRTIKESKVEFYGRNEVKFKRLNKAIESEIYPELERLFQEDSNQFNDAIQKRIDRDNEKNPIEKRRLALEARKKLIPAIETPIRIAELSFQLAQHAMFVFDYGFKSARGDSCVALSCAASSISGCISIIDLNLLSLEPTDWTASIRKKVERTRKEYDEILSQIDSRLNVLSQEVDRHTALENAIQLIQSKYPKSEVHSDGEIESLTRDLQNAIYEYQDVVWKNRSIDSPTQILNPKLVLKRFLDYAIVPVPDLGSFEFETGSFEVAGILNQEKRTVHISEKLKDSVQRFTLAHELGHAFLHHGLVLHREIPLEGVDEQKRNPIETQADKFATFFLMPKRQVIKVFKEKFGTEKLRVDEFASYGFGYKSVRDFDKFQTTLDLAIFIAKAVTFNGQTSKSLAEIFEVSITTMAIRLKELGLIEY